MGRDGRRLQEVFQDMLDISVDEVTAEGLLRMAKKKGGGSYVQWMTSDGQLFRPASTTVDRLSPGFYQVGSDMSGMYFARMNISTEGLIRLPDTNSDKVIEEIQSFWEKENLFRENNLTYKRGILLHGPPGCHARGTGILMADGSVMKVEDICVGDLLMGPDSKPRQVLELCRGSEEMYEITPRKGEPFRVNASHVLHLDKSKNRSKALPQVLNINVRDYRALSKPSQEKYKLLRTGVTFPQRKKLPVDPYFLGVWLGDGRKDRLHITTADPEIERCIQKTASDNGLFVQVKRRTDSICRAYYLHEGDVGGRKPRGRGNNAFKRAFRALGVYRNKHVPDAYLVASEKDRLKLLAGFVDTDGCYSEVSWRASEKYKKKGRKGYFEVIQKKKILADQVVWLARSVGLGATCRKCQKTIKSRNFKGTYYRISIYGDVYKVPVRVARKKACKGKPNKNPLHTGIRSVKSLGKNPYYGFTLSGDHLYLTSDFTVHHNSGKSATARIVTEDVITRGGIVIQFFDPGGFASALRVLRQIQPDVPVVVLMEDLDSILYRHVESSVINLLDGVGMIDKVVFLACHTPDTRLLTRDLRWVPAGDLRAGDELWGLDEHRSGRATKTGRETARRFRPSTVLSSFRAKKQCVRVHLDTGESFVCTEDHPWLSFGAKRQSGNNLEWTVATDLLSRPKLVRPFIPWSVEDTYEAGWLAGMLDGEGNIRKGRGDRSSGIGIVQAVGSAANRLINIAQKYGKFHVDVRKLPDKKHKDQVRMRSLGGFPEAASILGRVRPQRLIENFDLTGSVVQANFDARVIRIEPVGMCEIQSIETSTRTYFAEGFAVHNTTNYPEKMGERVVNRPSRFDRRFYIGPPNEAARRLYLTHLFSKGSEDPKNMALGSIDQWVGDTEGMSIAHLKELFVAVEILETPYEQAIRILRGMSILPNSEQYKGDQEEVVDSGPLCNEVADYGTGEKVSEESSRAVGRKEAPEFIPGRNCDPSHK